MSEKASSGEDRREAIIAALKEVYDPEIPVNIYDMGLIYVIEDRGEGEFHIAMTLTSPHCPVPIRRSRLPPSVESAVPSWTTTL